MIIELEKQYIADIKIRHDDQDIYESAVNRCVENHNDQGVAVPIGSYRQFEPGTREYYAARGWQDMYYPVSSVEDVHSHWAYNAVVNGVDDVSRLDGWADLGAGKITFSVDLTEW